MSSSYIGASIGNPN